MATAIVLNLPEQGHMNATYPVMAELVRRGERVVLYGTEPFRRRSEETGAEFCGYGNDAAFVPPAHQGGLYSVMAYLMGLAEGVLPDLLDRLRSERPSYLLIDSMCVWGHLAQQILGIPAVMLASVFVPHPELEPIEDMVQRAYGCMPREIVLAGIEHLNAYIETSRRIDRRHGTRSPNIVEFFAGRQTRNVIFSSRYFHLAGHRYDESYAFVGPSIAPRPGAPELDFGDAGDGPLIYISMGTIFNDLPRFYRACFAAFGGHACRVVLATGERIDRAALGQAPDNFIVRKLVPQLEVLERASLFLTHGGMNSASEALWHGVPLLVFPQHGDQHLVAARATGLGAALTLRTSDLEPARLWALAERVLSEPAFRFQAGVIASSFKAAGGYRRAADEILAFSRSGR